MNKRFLTIFLVLIMIFGFATNLSMAEKKGKVILIDLNRTSLNDLLEIKALREEVNKRGALALMNIKASQGTSDIRSFASIGAGTRSLVNIEDINFQTLNDQNKNIYLRRTNIKPKLINNLNANILTADNLTGEYGAFPGALGYELKKNNLKVAMLGNADNDIEQHREACLMAMDENGQIPAGNIDAINIQDDLMPFGIRTDYNKLLEETKNHYKDSDLVVVDLGDTYRLDTYKPNLNEDAYLVMKDKINKNISSYLNEVFKMANKEDKIYIVSPYPKFEDYQAGYRLAPIILFEGDDKGLLYSNTTRRAGIIANVDIPVDILDHFNIKPEFMAGKPIEEKLENNPVDFLTKDYQKIVSTANVRFPVLYTYAVFEMIIWMLALLAILFRKSIPKKGLNILNSVLKFTIALPLVFLIAPILKLKSQALIVISIPVILATLYYLIQKFVKDDLNILVVISSLTTILILIDVATGQYLMKNCILGYDAIVGARYYGVGNEYEGVILGVVVFALAGLLEFKKINKHLVGIILAITLFVEIYPKMGADVGGIFSGGFCFLYFMLKIYDIKIDFKKFIYICIAIGLGVVTMAVLDMYLGAGKSHLGSLVQKIHTEGIMAIVQVFQRKIEMNLKLIQSSIWSRVLIIAVIIVSILFHKPVGMLKKLCEMYPILAKAWTSIIVGSVVGFLTNDSGVIVAATGITYVMIPVLVLTIKNIDKLSSKA